MGLSNGNNKGAAGIGISEQCLRDAGCSEVFIERYLAREAAGDTQTCLRLLRLHRCELICALHEAQKPIDVCDWIIRDLENASSAA